MILMIMVIPTLHKEYTVIEAIIYLTKLKDGQ